MRCAADLIGDGWQLGVKMGKLTCAVAALCGLPLSLTLAGPVHASGDAVSSYVGDHGPEVCALINEQPTLTGVKHAVSHILETSGLPEDQTGRLLAGSVTAFCPEDGDLVEEFVWYIQHRQQNSVTGSGSALGS